MRSRMLGSTSGVIHTEGIPVRHGAWNIRGMTHILPSSHRYPVVPRRPIAGTTLPGPRPSRESCCWYCCLNNRLGSFGILKRLPPHMTISQSRLGRYWHKWDVLLHAGPDGAVFF